MRWLSTNTSKGSHTRTDGVGIDLTIVARSMNSPLKMEHGLVSVLSQAINGTV